MDTLLFTAPPQGHRKERSFVVFALFFLFAEVLTIIFSLATPWTVFFGILGIVFLYWISKKTFLGLCVLILLHFFVIRGTEEVSAQEVLFALSFVAILGVWFFRKVFLERQPVLIDSLDYALFAFLGISVLSIFPAFLFGSSLLKWLRELVPFLTLLLVFPIREEADSPKRMKILIACFLLLGLAIAINNLFLYRQAVVRALQLWQLTASRQSFNEPILMAIVISATGFLIWSKSALARWFALLVLTVFGIALLITFSRGYWVGALAGLLTLFWLLSSKPKWRMVGYLSLLVLIFMGVVSLFFGDLGAFILDVVGRRFHTIGQATEDLSFLNRLAEARAVFAQIKQNPILGYGLGKTYYYDTLIPIELPTWYVHNTLLFVWYKVGLFGLISLGVFTMGIFLRSVRGYKAETDEFFKTLLLNLSACLVGITAVSFSSPQLLEKGSSLLVAMVCGLVQSIWMQQGRRRPLCSSEKSDT